MSLIGALLTMSIVAASALLLFTMTAYQAFSLVPKDHSFKALQARDKVVYFLRHPDAWDKTLASSCNSGLACIKGNMDCFDYADVQGHWSSRRGITCLVDAAGGVIFDERDSQAGFNMRGQSCSTYGDLGTGCIYRPRVRWRSTCSVGPCVQRPIEIDVEIEVSPNAVMIHPNPRLTIYRR